MIQFEDFFDIEVRDHIAICWIDNKTESMNVVSPAIIGFFDILGPRLQEDDDIHAVIFISRKPDFPVFSNPVGILASHYVEFQQPRK